MPFNQDDQRERAMLSALNLSTRPSRRRDEEDGQLVITRGNVTQTLDFECKSSPVNEDFGTGRDTGLPKLRSWENFHFAFAWFEPRDNLPLRMWYGSPATMRGWIEKEKAYIVADLKLVDSMPSRAGERELSDLLGLKDSYTYDELNSIVKNQWNANARIGQENLYHKNADLNRARRVRDNLYSRDAALTAIRDRVGYLLARGSTVNNRKIQKSYIMANCPELNPNEWAYSLRQAVETYLENRTA